MSWGHWNVKFCNLANILPLPYTALTSSYVEPRETVNARFFGFSFVLCDEIIPVGPSNHPTICRPPSVASSVSETEDAQFFNVSGFLILRIMIFWSDCMSGISKDKEFETESFVCQM